MAKVTRSARRAWAACQLMGLCALLATGAWPRLSIAQQAYGPYAAPQAPAAPSAPQAPSAPAAPDAAAAYGQQADYGDGGYDPAVGAQGIPMGPGTTYDPAAAMIAPNGPDTVAPEAANLGGAAPAGTGAPASGDPPTQVGRLKQLRGEVTVAAARSPDQFVPARRNLPLTAQDEVRTGGDGLAELRLPGGTLYLAPASRLYVLRADQGGSLLRLHAGSVVVVVDAHDAPPVQVELSGDTSVQAKRGRIRIDALGTGESTIVTAVKSAAVIRTSTASHALSASQKWAASLVAPGRVQPAGSPVQDALAEFAGQQQHELQAAAPAQAETLRHVSRAMVGYEDLGANGQWQSTPGYGPLWTPTGVGDNWVPYRYGHWAFVLPWGWTWVDDQPWGFAPFHYGRWVHWQNRWSWAPGPYWSRPVYAPYLVGWNGGGGPGQGGSISWYPLGWGQPWMPSYPCSYGYARQVNSPYAPLHGGIGFRIGPAVRVPPSSITSVPGGAFYGGYPVGGAMQPFGGHTAGWSHRPPPPPQAAGYGGYGQYGSQGQPNLIVGPTGRPWHGPAVRPGMVPVAPYRGGQMYPGQMPGGDRPTAYGRPSAMPVYRDGPHYGPGPIPARPMMPSQHVFPHTMPMNGRTQPGGGVGFHGGAMHGARR